MVIFHTSRICTTIYTIHFDRTLRSDITSKSEFPLREKLHPFCVDNIRQTEQLRIERSKIVIVIVTPQDIPIVRRIDGSEVEPRALT